MRISINDLLDTDRHPLGDFEYVERCRAQLATDGALVLKGFARPATIRRAVAESADRADDAYYANTTHNVYLTPNDPSLSRVHARNRQVVSTKGLIADDQIPPESPLRSIYHDPTFQAFLSAVLDVARVYPYADELSSINVHFAPAGRELGWHFDNSSFAVTMLLQAPVGGAEFEYVPDVRDSASNDHGYQRVDAILDGRVSVTELDFAPGDLVLFRGRDALHRVRPTVGETTRLLVVFAYNDEPGVRLADSALATFYGRGVEQGDGMLDTMHRLDPAS